MTSQWLCIGNLSDGIRQEENGPSRCLNFRAEAAYRPISSMSGRCSPTFPVISGTPEGGRIRANRACSLRVLSPEEQGVCMLCPGTQPGASAVA
jgi:hypothetical protein